LLPIRLVSNEAAAAAHLAFQVGGPHARHFHFEQLLDSLLHLGLIGGQRHFEAQRGMFILGGHAFFGGDQSKRHFMYGHFASASENLRAAASESSTRSWPRR